MMTDRFWHIAQDGKEEGPLSASDICAKINEGSITSDAYVFKIGTHVWIPITEREEFVHEFTKIPPPPPPLPKPKVAAASTTPSAPIPTSEPMPVEQEEDESDYSQSRARKKSKRPRRSFQRVIGRLFLAATLGVGVFAISRGSVGAAGIAAVLGLAIGASPAGWLSMAVAAVGLKFAYESYDPKPHCIYFSDSKVVGSIKSLSTLCYSDRKECMDAVPFHATTGNGQFVGCWNTCNNLDDYNCKIRTLMEGHRAR